MDVTFLNDSLSTQALRTPNADDVCGMCVHVS